MWAGMDRGQLEAHTAAAERAQATAPPDVSGQLRATAHAEADARQQAADAQIRNDAAEAASASALAGELAARRQQLEAGNAEYEAWADRDPRRQGKRRQGRRRTEPPRPHPAAARTASPARKTRNPRRSLGSGTRRCSQAVDRARRPAMVGADQGRAGRHPAQAGNAARREALSPRHPAPFEPTPRSRCTAPGHQAASDAASRGRPNASHRPRTAPTPKPRTSPARTEPATEHDDPAARITKAITEVEDAARQIGAEQADRHARSEYAARLSREAQAQPEATAEAHADLAAHAPDEAEIEM